MAWLALAPRSKPGHCSARSRQAPPSRALPALRSNSASQPRVISSTVGTCSAYAEIQCGCCGCDHSWTVVIAVGSAGIEKQNACKLRDALTSNSVKASTVEWGYGLKLLREGHGWVGVQKQHTTTGVTHSCRCMRVEALWGGSSDKAASLPLGTTGRLFVGLGVGAGVFVGDTAGVPDLECDTGRPAEQRQCHTSAHTRTQQPSDSRNTRVAQTPSPRTYTLSW